MLGLAMRHNPQVKLLEHRRIHPLQESFRFRSTVFWKQHPEATAAEAYEAVTGKDPLKKDAGKSGKKTIKSTLGNKIDVTPSSKHTSVNKNPGPYGEANTSMDILDAREI